MLACEFLPWPQWSQAVGHETREAIQYTLVMELFHSLRHHDHEPDRHKALEATWLKIVRVAWVVNALWQKWATEKNTSQSSRAKFLLHIYWRVMSILRISCSICNKWRYIVTSSPISFRVLTTSRILPYQMLPWSDSLCTLINCRLQFLS